MNSWTEKEESNLIAMYENSSQKDIMKLIKNKTWHQIQIKANRLKLFRRKDYYSEDEIKFIQNNYGIMKSGKIATKLGRSSRAVERKARELGLKKQFKWTNLEEDILIENYGKMSVEEICKSKLLNRTIDSIHHKANSLGLDKKQPSYASISNKDLLDILREFYLKTNRTPTKDELGTLGLPSYYIYVERFETYSNACNLADIPINSGIFNFKIYYSKNEDMCWSNSEKLITDFFIDNDIYFEKEVYYSSLCSEGDCGHSRCDWVLYDGSLVEFFGMMKISEYKKVVEKKRKLCSLNNLNLIELFNNDLKKLNKIFYAYMNHP